MVRITEDKITIEFSGSVEDFTAIKNALLNLTISAQNSDSKTAEDTTSVLMLLREMELTPKQIKIAA